MTDEEMLRIANEIANPHGFTAEFLPGIRRVGVGGDSRRYGPVVVLVGPFISHEVLALISTEIMNQTEIGGVTIETASRQNSPLLQSKKETLGRIISEDEVHRVLRNFMDPDIEDFMRNGDDKDP